MTKHEMPTHGANAPQPVRSLRDWLDHLGARGRLAVLKPKIGLKFELAAYAKRLDGQRATLFPQPGGHAIPVVSGLVSDRGWIAEAMGVEPAEMLARFQDAASNPTPWQEVKSAPAQETVHRAPLDLAKLLPLPTHNEHDGGPYIAAGIMIVRNPRTGKQNVSIHRCQLTGPNRLGVLVLPRHTFTFHRMAEEAGQPLDAAIVIGVDPLRGVNNSLRVFHTTIKGANNGTFVYVGDAVHFDLQAACNDATAPAFDIVQINQSTGIETTQTTARFNQVWQKSLILTVTAIDAATQAKRLGAKEVTLVYRRTQEEMPCTEVELNIAKLDGCRVLWLAAPKEVKGSNGKVSQLVCSVMQLGAPDAGGRRSPVETTETFTLEVDMVIKAAGQIPFEALVRNSKVDNAVGRISIDNNSATNINGVFAGGDCVNGGKEVVDAVQAGKDGAAAILKYMEV